jgi:hypothetical protein
MKYSHWKVWGAFFDKAGQEQLRGWDASKPFYFANNL